MLHAYWLRGNVSIRLARPNPVGPGFTRLFGIGHCGLFGNYLIYHRGGGSGERLLDVFAHPKTASAAGCGGANGT